MEAKLRDGTWIEIRPLEPADRDILLGGFERLSAESRYQRFFGPMPELRERDLEYLVNVDHRDHEAMLAVAHDSGEGVGVARYVRTGPDVAEPALVVVDDWQGRGVGGSLLRALVDRAREEGIKRFEAPVLATNHEAIRTLERIGRTTIQPEGREVILTIELPPAPQPGPRWSELLRQFRTGALEPGRTLLQLLWPRRPGSPEDERSNVIIVGVDSADGAEPLIRAASALAAPSHATVELVGAHRFVAGQEPEVVEAVRDAATALRDQGIAAREYVRRGDPALVLTDLAQERNARLIVVGAGRRRTSRRILGGVSDLVAERAPCSVLIVRERDDES